MVDGGGRGAKIVAKSFLDLCTCANGAVNSFGLLSCNAGVGQSGPDDGGRVGGFKVGPSQPKRAQPCDFDAGWVPIERSRPSSEPRKPKKGPIMSSKVKDKALIFLEAIKELAEGTKALEILSSLPLTRGRRIEPWSSRR